MDAKCIEINEVEQGAEVGIYIRECRARVRMNYCEGDPLSRGYNAQRPSSPSLLKQNKYIISIAYGIPESRSLYSI